MTSHRRSDENSNPESEPDVDDKSLKPDLKVKPLPLVPTNEASTSKRRLSTFEQRDKRRFEASGMKKGSLFKYFVKDNDTHQDMHEPSNNKKNVKPRNKRNVSTSSASANHGAHRPTRLSRDSHNGTNGDAVMEGLSQDSDIECLGVAEREKKEYEVIPVPSDSDDGSVSKVCFDADSPQISSSYCDDDGELENVDIEHSVNISSSEDMESAISTLDNQVLSGEDKIARWQRQNKRLMQDEESGSKSCVDLEPPPSKSCRLEVDEVTPPKNASSSIRIVNVFTLKENESTPSSSSSTPACEQLGEKVKKCIFRYKEQENPILHELVKKKNWRKAIDVIRKDLDNNLLPGRTFVTQLIKQAILCVGTRVSKNVPVEGLKLLEDIVKLYPPQTGNGTDPSVKYYKEIFEKVFDDGSAQTGESPLNRLITHIHDSLPDKHGFQLLNLVTELVENQFDVYCNGKDIKVSPPLFQFFLEAKDGVFAYNGYCKSVVEKCFKAKCDEEFCLYLKWVNLLARKLGQFKARHRKDFSFMVDDFSEFCRDIPEVGLKLIMNISFQPFSKAVCEAIFKKLTVVGINDDTSKRISDADRLEYLMELSQTSLIKPADQIISDVTTVTCENNPNLNYFQTKVDFVSTKRVKIENQDRARKRNNKGETKLHVYCQPGKDSTPAEIKAYIREYPDDVNARDNFGNTPLHDCARHDKGNVIGAMYDLRTRGELSNVDFLARNQSLETPMHLAATYCSSGTIDVLKYFAKACGVLDQVLTAANSSGELPFHLTNNDKDKLNLKPKGYDENAVYHHKNLTLDKSSIDLLNKSFELRKILAWWYRNCRNA